MAIQKLPPELISLVHHIELNKAGWWDKGLDQLLITAIWVAGRDQSVGEILAQLKKSFQVEIEIEKAQSHLSTLCSKSILVPMPDDRYKISEEYLEKYDDDIREAEALEKAVEESFIVALTKHCPGIDVHAAWKDFNERFLLPFVRDVGANTYRLLSEGNLKIAPSRFKRFVRTYPEEIHEPFAEVVKEFLDPKNLQLRSYILRSLNAFFFIEAGSLTKETIEALTKLSGSQPTFNIFVDTNFLFSILGLIPSAADGRSLIKLISRIKGNVNVRLYALPTTVDEARRKLISTKQFLAGLRVVPNLAEAASRMRLDGLALKFFEESPKRGLMSAEDYFEPYIADLISMMRTKGVELYNEDVDHYKTKPAVIDDIMVQLESERKKHKERAKDYEKLEHDMVLWHVTRDMRPVRIESPLDARCWVVTIDYRMLGFDKFKKQILKRRGDDSSVPVCLYPTTLIQMLQFWVPRTPEFEEAMLSSMRLPFLYQEFDYAAEKITLDILRTLGQYENIGDLKTEAVSSILMSKALRNKMSATKDVEKKVKLIREALLEQHKKTTAELHTLTERLKLKEKELEEESVSKRTAEQQLANKHTELESLQQMVQELKSTSEIEKDVLSDRITQLEEAASAKDLKSQIQRERTVFIVKWLAVPLLLIIMIMTTSAFVLSTTTGWKLWQMLVGFHSIGLLIWAIIFDWLGSRTPHVRDWPPFIRFKKLRKVIFGILGALILGVLANFIHDWLKPSVPTH